MDRALWLLARLRVRGWLRRVGRNLGTVRGALLAAVGALVFLPWVVAWLFQDAKAGQHLVEVRRYGPLALACYCVLNLLLSSEGALAFSAAEVNFLFPAPLSRRQILAYRLASTLGSALLSAVVFSLFLRRYAAGVLSGMVGMVLTMAFLQLVPMVLTLLASAIGVRAYNRQRRVLLLLLLAAVAAGLLPAAVGLADRDWRERLEAVEQSAVAQVLLAPFSWFVNAFTAEVVWPDLLQLAGLGLLVDLLLIGLVFVLDAHYLEASAAVSERVYARQERLRRGGSAVGGFVPSGKARLKIPSLPWWGGCGPIAWRQLVTALRTPSALLSVGLIVVLFVTPAVLSGRAWPGERAALFAVGMMGALGLVVSTLLPFDFRLDLDRMELLKTFPIPTERLVLGQVLVPVALLTGFQFLLVGGLQVCWQRVEPVLLAGAVFLPVVNLLVFEADNLLFLWFPTRHAAAPGDLQMIGRQVVLWMAKLLVLEVFLLLAFLAGLVAFLVLGESWVGGGIVAWLVLAGCAGAVVPLLGIAFRRFDVSRDLP